MLPQEKGKEEKTQLFSPKCTQRAPTIGMKLTR